MFPYARNWTKLKIIFFSFESKIFSVRSLKKFPPRWVDPKFPVEQPLIGFKSARGPQHFFIKSNYTRTFFFCPSVVNRGSKPLRWSCRQRSHNNRSTSHVHNAAFVRNPDLVVAEYLLIRTQTLKCVIDFEIPNKQSCGLPHHDLPPHPISLFPNLPSRLGHGHD